MVQIVRVVRRGAQQLQWLGVECDQVEIPSPLHSKPDGYFIGAATLRSAVQAADESGVAAGPAGIDVTGVFAATVFDGRVAVIVDPFAGPGFTVWAVVGLAQARIEGVGRQGIVRRRPQRISIQTADTSLDLVEIVQFFPNRQLKQPWRSGVMLEMLMSVARGSDAQGREGWYDDPQDPTIVRYWNGSIWTDSFPKPIGFQSKG